MKTKSETIHRIEHLVWLLHRHFIGDPLLESHEFYAAMREMSTLTQDYENFLTFDEVVMYEEQAKKSAPL